MSDGFQGHYRPELLPGHVARDRPDINRPATQTSSGGLGTIESRFYTVKANSQVVGLDSALKTFLDQDVPILLRIAMAADRWSKANNGEKSRQASEQLLAAVRAIK